MGSVLNTTYSFILSGKLVGDKVLGDMEGMAVLGSILGSNDGLDDGVSSNGSINGIVEGDREGARIVGSAEGGNTGKPLDVSSWSWSWSWSWSSVSTDRE